MVRVLQKPVDETALRNFLSQRDGQDRRASPGGSIRSVESPTEPREPTEGSQSRDDASPGSNRNKARGPGLAHA